MKLKYDKTGEYGKLVFCKDDDRYAFYIEATGCRMYYHSFRQMVEAGWEVCKEPKEPLIKDEKIRKAVRAWADAGDIKEVGVVISREETTFCDDNTGITFYGELSGLIDGADYTITELCGEEE